ncbi:MAG: lasso peptide biosynthesis B2 protein [Acidobacteria bacterium]|nr:lasso peptide biosynthesis B2 protein [Acidobacteriota bacterium]
MADDSGTGDTNRLTEDGALASTGRYRAPLDLVLFSEALIVARVASRVTSRPIPEVARAVMRTPVIVRTTDSRRAVRAAGRATSRLARRGAGLDTCLTRALVTAALLPRRSAVTLRIGFRPPSQASAVDGHAWLAVDGEDLEIMIPPGDAGQRHTQVLKIPMRSPRTSRKFSS